MTGKGLYNLYAETNRELNSDVDPWEVIDDKDTWELFAVKLIRLFEDRKDYPFSTGG